MAPRWASCLVLTLALSTSLAAQDRTGADQSEVPPAAVAHDPFAAATLPPVTLPAPSRTAQLVWGGHAGQAEVLRSAVPAMPRRRVSTGVVVVIVVVAILAIGGLAFAIGYSDAG